MAHAPRALRARRHGLTRLLLPVAAIALLAAAGAGREQDVRITGNDYAFVLPQHVAAGETRFSFQNEGRVRHELSIALIKPGFDPDSVVANLVAGSARRDFLDGQASLIVSRPDDAPGPRLLIDLLPGRAYLVVCTLRDAPDRPTHAMLGMIGVIRIDR